MKYMKEKIATPLGMDEYEAAEAICKIMDGKMQTALKGFVTSKGMDPAKFALISYGGAGNAHCAGFATGLGFADIVIPSCAAVFSAFGASTADIRHMYEGSPFIIIPQIPHDPISLRFKLDEITSLDQIPSMAIERFNQMFIDLEKLALRDMTDEGVDMKGVKLFYEMKARYGMQLWDIRVNLSVNQIKSVKDIKAILREFEEEYIKVYGEMVMLPRGGVEIMSLAVITTAPTIKINMQKFPLAGADAADALKKSRDVYFNGKFVTTKIYDMHKLKPGNVVEGPAIIEVKDTTIVIPPNCEAKLDEYLNLRMHVEG